VPVLLDTSVLIGAEEGPDEDAAISVVSLTELHFGVLVAPDEEIRADRMRRLAIVEDRFDALPFDTEAARECGRLHAAVAHRGGKPRRRAFDLAIAATANTNRVPLLAYNTKDFEIVKDLVDVRRPSD
jgi:predicted nucleic acid-binding protein